MARRRRNFPRRGPKRRAFKQSFKTVCTSCGKELMVEVAPPAGKDLLCLDCYKKEGKK